jgi:hypothetical protein
MNNNTATDHDSDLVTLFITPIGPQQIHELGEQLPWIADPNWQPPTDWILDSEVVA